jgi:hypothetical protein
MLFRFCVYVTVLRGRGAGIVNSDWYLYTLSEMCFTERLKGFVLTSSTYKNVKQTHNTPVEAQSGRGCIAPTHL